MNGPQVDDSKCSFPCEANKSEICGGNDELSIWQDPTFPKGPDDTTVDSYKSLGCYTDKGPGRTLSWDSKADAATLTTKSCLAACEKKGYPYAGTEFGDECYCGSVLANNTAKTDDAECNSPCAGDASEKCGGRNALNLYVATDLESLEPCGYKPHTTTTTATTKSGFSTTTRRSHTTTTTTTTRHSQESTTTTRTKKTTTTTTSKPSQESTTTTRTRKTTTTTTSKPSQESTSTTRTRKTTTSTTSRHSQETTTTTTTKPSHHSTTTRTRKTTTTTTTKPSHHSTTTSKPSHHSTTSKSRETTTTTTTTKPSHHSTTSKSRETTTTTTKPSHHSTTTTSKPSHHSTTSKTRQTTTTKSTTTTKGSHTTTTTTAVCTATHTSPPKCEWQIGDWCAPPLPDWDNKLECLVAAKTCELQGVSCFAKAGFPHVIDCFKFTKWCIAVKAHCVTDCVLQKGCGKRECWDKNKPGPGTPPSTSTSVYPCPPSTTLKPTTTTKPPVTTSCAPEPTNVCTQPTNDKWGYGPGKPVGGIPLPAVCCNDIKDDFNKNPFKLYNDPDSKKCPSFPWPSRPNVCQDACKEQYEDCRNTYVTGCKTLGRKRSIGLSAREAEATSAQDVEFERRWLLSWSSGDQASCSSTGNAGSWGGKGSDSPSCWGKGGNTPDKALQRCKAQYDDCMVVNKKVDPGDKCRTWCDKN